MAGSRIEHSVKNAKTSVGFFLLLLFVNFFSRRLFLDTLGDDLCGLTTLMNYTVGFLNVADIGIATAVSCALYGPIARNDRKEINDITSLLGYLFRLVGLFILLAGGVIAFFITDIAGDSVPKTAIYFAYFTFLFTSSITYLVNYKQFLLGAAQKAYIITSLLNSTNITKLALQIISVWMFSLGYYAFLVLEVLGAITYSWLLNRRIKREYGWLTASVSDGAKLIGKYKGIFKSIKQIVSHKVADVVLVQSDSIIIAKLISLGTVTIYQNYFMLVGRVVTFAVSIFSGVPAAIGNLVASEDSGKSLIVFKQYNALSHLVGGVFAFGVYNLASPFILLWLGSEHYVLPDLIVALVTLNMYISIVKMPLYSFLNGYGIYSDVWAPWSESALNLFISIWGAYHFGLAGVAAGTAISTGATTFLWKPYLLFSKGLKQSVTHYYASTLKYIFIFISLMAGSDYLIKSLDIIPTNNFFSFFGVGIAVTILFALVYFGLIYISCRSARELSSIIIRTLLKRG